MTSTLPDQDRPTKTQQDRPIIGHRKRQLLRDIAVGDLSLQEIAEKYNRSYQWIRVISSQNKEEIAEIKEQFLEDFDRDLNKLWITDKFNRLAERLKMYRAICDHQQKLEEESEEFGIAVGEHWLRYEAAKQKLLREIEDALGALPQRAPSSEAAAAVPYTVKIVGVDVESAFPVDASA